jgi:hypothetical protein
MAGLSTEELVDVFMSGRGRSIGHISGIHAGVAAVRDAVLERAREELLAELRSKGQS